MWKAMIVAMAAPFIGWAASAETLGEYTKRLIEKHGVEATVITGLVTGTNEKGVPFVDQFPTPGDDSTLVIFATSPEQEQTCEQLGRDIIDEETAGAFTYRWCVSEDEHPDHEAKRDTWVYMGGRYYYVASSHFDCQDQDDLAAMTDPVKVALCY